MINKESPVPIYFQLENLIKEMIDTRELKPGDVVPSEREYAEKYGISRMTVRQAMKNLTSEGYLERKRGKGTFVAIKKLEQSLNFLTSFSEEMRARGMVPTTKVLDFNIISADKFMATKLGIEEGSPVYEVTRLRFGDDIPIAYQIFYTSVDLVPSLTKEMAEQSIYRYIERESGLSFISAEHEIEAKVALQEEANALGVKVGHPILYISRIGYSHNEKPLEYAESYFRGDYYKVKMKIKG
ncbi:GntR family transcriptional regulator [Sutcliffiella cohnii]